MSDGRSSATNSAHLRAGPMDSGIRRPGPSLGLPAVGQRSGLSDRVISQVLLLVMAFGVWWLLSRYVTEVQPLENRAVLKAVLDASDAELMAEYRVTLATQSERATLRVSGPRAEYNAFRDEIDRMSGGPQYQCVISAEDIKWREPDEEFQIVLNVPLERFKAVEEYRPVAQVSYELTDLPRTVRVVLERIVTRPVTVDTSRIELPPTVARDIRVDGDISVRGPWSAVRELARNRDPSAGFVVMTQPMNLVKDVEERLRRGAGRPEDTEELMVPAQLERIPDVVFLDQHRRPVANVVLKVPVSERLVERAKNVPVTLELPHWMAVEKKVEVTSTTPLDMFPLVLLIDPEHNDRFNEQNVRVVLDLHDITREALLSSPGASSTGSSHRGSVEVRLKVAIDDDTRLTYRLPDTLKDYRVTLQIAWQD